MDDFQALAQAAEAAVEDAEKAQQRSQFGKLTIGSRYIKWNDGQPEDIDVKTYMDLPGNQRTMELNFVVDIQEFNSDLEWTYERKVRVGSSDWWSILKPSIEEMEGFKGSMGKGKMPETLGKLNGSYVHVYDVLQAPTKRNPNPEYKTIKFAQVFGSRQECYEAWQAAFGGSNGFVGSTSSVKVPPGWEDDAESWSSMSIDFYAELAELAGTAGKNRVLGINKLAEEYGTTADWVKAELSDIEG